MMMNFPKIKSGVLEKEEIGLIRSVVGEGAPGKSVDIGRMRIFLVPEADGKRAFSNFSLPFKIICIPDDPLSSAYKKSIVVHEIFHQFQYAESLLSFFKLVAEQVMYRIFGRDVYDYGREEFFDGTKKIERLDDIKTLEGRAGFVQDFAYNYLSWRDMQNVRDSLDAGRKEKQMFYMFRAARYAEVLKKSGFSSKAIDELTA